MEKRNDYNELGEWIIYKGLGEKQIISDFIPEQIQMVSLGLVAAVYEFKLAEHNFGSNLF